MSTKPDSLVPYADGRLKLTLDGKPYTLRRPTIGEQWGFDEGLATIRSLEAEDAEWAFQALGDAAGVDPEALDRLEPARLLRAARQITPEESNKRVRRKQEALLGWWLEVFTKLCSNFPETPMEDLPVFLVDGKTVTLAQEAWARNPQGPGDE